MHHISELEVLLHVKQSKNILSDERFHILDSENILWPDVLYLSKSLQWSICGFCWIAILVGSYFRHILYKYLYNRYKKKDFKYIDVLTLVAAVAHHFSIIFHAILITLIVLQEANANYIVGNWYCELSRNVVIFDMFYSVLGRVGIAIYRLCYIRFHTFSCDGGEKKTCCFILAAGWAIALVCVVILRTTEYEKTLQDNCILVPKPLFLLTLDEYEISRGDSAIHSYWSNLRATMGIFGLCLNAAQLIIYINIFYNLYKHDNSERIRRLLDPSVTKRRNRNNAITFFGQFCSYVVDLSILLFIIISANVHAWYMVFVLKYVGFVAVSIVEVVTSNELRSRLFGA